MVDAILYGYLYTYSNDLANQTAEGSDLEDEINKTGRPIGSKITDATATRLRYAFITSAWLLYSYVLQLEKWTLLWIVTVFSSYMLRLARIGPAKDCTMALGATAQLMASWEMGGSEPAVGWRWVKIIATWVFFTVSIQDIRDVPGDFASGRKTTPILLGNIPGMLMKLHDWSILLNLDDLGRIYTSFCLIVFGVSF